MCCGILTPSKAWAKKLYFRVGPPALGNGGPNPISIPPTNVAEWEVSYVNDAHREYVYSISPGFFYGFLTEFSGGLYVGLGPGIVINANGVGLGGYSSVGYEFGCGFLCFSLEYKQAVGIAGAGVISPYALRLGFGFEM